MVHPAYIHQMITVDRPRCPWCRVSNETYRNYHDFEWGRPVDNDQQLFEALTLEIFQAGLSWECILQRRAAFRKAFCHFDYHVVAQYTSSYVEELIVCSDIIRHRGKIEAAINNAKVFIHIQQEFTSFRHYLDIQTGGQRIVEWDKSRSALSDLLSADLKKRGMKYVGSTTIYSFLQAIGIIYSHVPECWLHGLSEDLRETPSIKRQEN